MTPKSNESNYDFKIQDIKCNLSEFIKKYEGDESNLFEFLKKISEKGKELCKINEIQESLLFKNNKNKKEKPKSKKIEKEESDKLFVKKCSMKTARDVVDRIQWDEQIDRNLIVVGYIDRFTGLREVNFNVFDWGDIVLADLGALAIPEHRINYFKYKNHKIWDKHLRLDNVFGSTGSKKTMTDVISELKNVDMEAQNGTFEMNNQINQNYEQETIHKVNFKQQHNIVI
jgi:uncharacterized protein (UPF0248 family)